MTGAVYFCVFGLIREKHRIITFRFCNMEDANTFKGVLQRDPEWEHCIIRFAPDP